MATVPAPVHRDRTFQRVQFVLLVILVLVVGLLLRHDWASDSTTSTTRRGSGIAATQTRILAPFTRIELAGANKLSVRVGSAQAVAVHGDDNLIDRVTTAVQDGTLLIGNRGSFTTKQPMSVEVTVPSIENVVLSGSGSVEVHGVHAQQLTIRVPGAGSVSVSGTVDRLDANLSGTGDVRLGDLVARDVRATVSGTGHLEVHPTQSLDASVTGVGAIVYHGHPHNLVQQVTGTGSISSD